MSERHELEMKAEEIFNMVFAPLGWDPDDDDDEAKDIVDRAVNDGLMEMPDPDDMESALDECAQTAQEKMRDDIIERVLSVEKTVRIPWRRAAPPMAWRYAMPTARDTARWMRSCSGIRTGLLKRLIIACRTGCRALCLTCLV